MDVSFGNTRRCQLSYKALGTSKIEKERKKKKKKRGACKYTGCVLKLHHKLVKNTTIKKIQQSRERMAKVAIQSYRVHKKSYLSPL